MAVKKYQFKTKSRTVITPYASTLFMCLAEPNEVTGNYGGKLVFLPSSLDLITTEQLWGSRKKEKKAFGAIVNDMIDEVVAELKDAGKKVTRAEKFVQATDKDGNDIEGFEFSCKNKDKPAVVDTDRQKLPDFDKLVGNGSTLKARINLVPYTMSGKAGVTAYIDYVLLKDLIEYGDDGDVFDDDDFNEDSVPFDTSDTDVDVTDGGDF